MARFRFMSSPVIPLNGLKLTLIGPHEQDLKDLRAEWRTWVRDHQELIVEIREQARREADQLHADEGLAFQHAIARLAGRLAQTLGDRDRVTTPNLASLMLLAEENGTSVLLTGDGHGKDILKGLDHADRLDASGRIHVDVLKLQHHGSEHNLDAEFCGAVTADHYVICGDGSHHNPDLEAIGTLIDARAAADSRPFKLWFNASETTVPDARKEHMRKLEELVTAKRREVGSRLTATFLRRGSHMKVSV